MVDRSTFICYIKSKENTCLPNFPTDLPWNNKKWRCLMFLDTSGRNLLFAGRQYPFPSLEALNILKDTILQEFLKCNPYWNVEWSKWKDDYIDKNPLVDIEEGIDEVIWDKYIPMGGFIYGMSELVKNEPGSLNFNDLIHSSIYKKPFYAFKKMRFSRNAANWMVNADSRLKFNIGGAVKCLCCGKEDIRNEATMVCDDCMVENSEYDNEDIRICPWCGRRMLYDDGVWYGDDLLCPSCAEEVAQCESCHSAYLKEDLIYDELTDAYYCSWCYKDLIRERKADDGSWKYREE